MLPISELFRLSAQLHTPPPLINFCYHCCALFSSLEENLLRNLRPPSSPPPFMDTLQYSSRRQTSSSSSVCCWLSASLISLLGFSFTLALYVLCTYYLHSHPHLRSLSFTNVNVIHLSRQHFPSERIMLTFLNKNKHIFSGATH